MEGTAHITIAGLNEGSRSFMRMLEYGGRPYLFLSNSKREEKELRELGVPLVLHLDTRSKAAPPAPPVPVGDVFIFESSLALSCRYLQCCRLWTEKSVYVITRNWHPGAIYKGLGATHIIYSQTGEVGFLFRDYAGNER